MRREVSQNFGGESDMSRARLTLPAAGATLTPAIRTSRRQLVRWLWQYLALLAAALAVTCEVAIIFVERRWQVVVAESAVTSPGLLAEHAYQALYLRIGTVAMIIATILFMVVAVCSGRQTGNDR
jgi:hypothetical protein